VEARSLAINKQSFIDTTRCYQRLILVVVELTFRSRRTYGIIFDVAVLSLSLSLSWTGALTSKRENVRYLVIGDDSVHNCALPAAIENYLVSPSGILSYSGRVAALFNRCIPLRGTLRNVRPGIYSSTPLPASRTRYFRTGRNRRERDDRWK